MCFAPFGNIPLQYRSKLTTIQLVVAGRSVHIKKHGIKKLRDFLGHRAYTEGP